jgi:ribosomal protein L9
MFTSIGAIVPVARGTMRNLLYPNGIASYVSPAELSALELSRKSLERQSFKPEPKTKQQDSRLIEQMFSEEGEQSQPESSLIEETLEMDQKPAEESK